MKFFMGLFLFPFCLSACIHCQEQIEAEKEAAFILYKMNKDGPSSQYYFGKCQGLLTALKIYNNIHNICETYENEQTLYESGIGLD